VAILPPSVQVKVSSVRRLKEASRLTSIPGEISGTFMDINTAFKPRGNRHSFKEPESCSLQTINFRKYERLLAPWLLKVALCYIKGWKFGSK
jgi:hypothetical protein